MERIVDPHCGRLLPFAAGGLRVVQRFPGLEVFANFADVATTVVQISTLTDSRRPIGVIAVTVFLTLRESIGFDQVDVWSSFIHE